MNIEKYIQDEMASITSLISAVQNQFNTEKYLSSKTPNDIPPDYHVLFIKIPSISYNNTVYTMTSTYENIFYEAVTNFKHSVEAFSQKNVHIVPTIKVISETVYIPDNRTYLVFEDLYDKLREYSSVGLYDAVIAVSANCGYLGMTTMKTLSDERIMHGFSHIHIYAGDATRVGQGYSDEYPHLTTTNSMIHEWMHQLEKYRNNIVPEYPYTHGYSDPTSYGYSWDEHVFDDPFYDNMVEKSMTAYYYAVLSAKVAYNNGSETHYIGMIPLLWKVTPRKLVIGRYLVQKNSGEYYYNNNGTYSTSASLSNDIRYIWNVYYSIYAVPENDTNYPFRIKNFVNNYRDLPLSYTTLTFTRVGPYDEGEYYLVNTSLSNSVLGYTSANALNMVTYRSNNMQTFTLSYYSEMYFSLMATALSGKYLDLNNDTDYEDNIIDLSYWTGCTDSQTWQYRFDESAYKIMPKKSPTRSLSFHNNSLHITSSSNIQNWKPELISNGKFIFNGKYKLRTSTGKYLTYNGGVIKLGTTGAEWQFTSLSGNDNYYSISVQNVSSASYMELAWGSDSQGNLISLKSTASDSDAQSWKIMLDNDGSVVIISRASLTRGLLTTGAGSMLSVSPTKFYLEKL